MSPRESHLVRRCFRPLFFAFVLVLLAGPALAQDADLPTPDPRTIPDLPIQYPLWEAQQLAQTLGPMSTALTDTLDDLGLAWEPGSNGPRLLVEVVGPDSLGPVSTGVILAVGGSPGAVWRSYTDAWVPVLSLTDLATSLPSGYVVQLADMNTTDAAPAPARLDVHTNTGVNTIINTRPWHAAGFRGKDVTIAVIDGGFQGLVASQNAGDSPTGAACVTPNVTSVPLDGRPAENHGTLCLEAAYDVAPQARYVLYSFKSIADLGDAVDDAIARNVDLISFSAEGFNSGWHDGTGPYCKAFDAAADAGIVVFCAAGNQGLQHYQGTFGNPNGAKWHRFENGTDEIEVNVPSGTQVRFHLQWDRTNNASADYDLFLYRWDAVNRRYVKLAEATTWNTRWASDAGAFETLTWTNSANAAETVYLGVWKDDGNAADFEVYGYASRGAGVTWNTNIVSNGSTASPSNSEKIRIVPVGAIAAGCYAPGGANCATGRSAADPLELFSAWGHTNDGIFSVQLTAPDRLVTGSTGGAGFAGTSCATPVAAATTAVVSSANRVTSMLSIANAVKDWATRNRDWPPAGLDRYYGWGAVYLPNRPVVANPRQPAMPPHQVQLVPVGTTRVEVALLGSADFDVHRVAPQTVGLRLDGDWTEAAPFLFSDVDSDGYDDAIYAFDLPDTLPAGPADLALHGLTLPDSLPWVAVDSVDVVFAGATGVECALASSSTGIDHVTLTWSLPAHADGSIAVERTASDGAWATIGTTTIGGDGRATFVDHAVVAGESYRYRPGLENPAGPQWYAGAEALVTVPRPELVLFGATPNPASGGPPTVRFALASRSHARLEVFDLAGRRTANLELTGLAPGSHEITLGKTSLEPGVYRLRLEQDGRTVSRTMVVIR